MGASLLTLGKEISKITCKFKELAAFLSLFHENSTIAAPKINNKPVRIIPNSPIEYEAAVDFVNSVVEVLIAVIVDPFELAVAVVAGGVEYPVSVAATISAVRAPADLLPPYFPKNSAQSNSQGLNLTKQYVPALISAKISCSDLGSS